MIGDAVREIGAGIGAAEISCQELGEFEDAWQKRIQFAMQGGVIGLLRQVPVLLADHHGAGRGRDHHGFRIPEAGDKPAGEFQRLQPVAGIVVHLAAAGLLGTEFDRVPQSFEHGHGGLAGGGKQGVVETGDKQGDAHFPPSG